MNIKVEIRQEKEDVQKAIKVLEFVSKRMDLLAKQAGDFQERAKD